MPQPYKYDGPRSEAVLVRNRTRAEVRIEIPYRDVAGEIVKSSGVTVMQDLILASVTDEGIDGSEARPDQLVEKREWARLEKRSSIRSMVTDRTIEVFSA
jgi:hypothetical protein